MAENEKVGIGGWTCMHGGVQRGTGIAPTQCKSLDAIPGQKGFFFTKVSRGNLSIYF